MHYFFFGKKMIKETDNADNLLLPNHHLIKKKKNFNWYWEIKFKAIILSPCINPSLYTNISSVLWNYLKLAAWTGNIYLLPHLVTLDSYSGSLKYKILNNVLYLNKKLFMFWKLSSPLCLFFKLSDETVLHLFYKCGKV